MAQNALRTLEVRLTPDHPDVRHLQNTIKELEGKVAAEAAERAKSPGSAPPRPLTPEEAARQKHIAELQTELARLDLQLKGKDATEKRLRGEISALEGRVSATPLREAELTGLTRDYDTLRKNYEGLLAKYEDAKVAANLEHREIGEQFKVLDAASLPQAPISPNRPFLDLLGALGGLSLGLGLVALLEFSDRSIRSEDDAVLCLSLPVLALVPVLDTTADRRRWRRRRVLKSAAAVILMGVAAYGAVAWKLGWLSALMVR